MSRRFRAHRKDASHKAVVAAFEAHGCSVNVIEQAKTGCPDLVVGYLGVDHGVEVKPTKEQAGKDWRRDTVPRESQLAFHARWRGAPIHVVRTVEDVVALVAMWRASAATATRAAIALRESEGAK